ncbi:ABC transporter permease [Yoonia sediminilitoris]|uniref:Putative ABC transport system permease protein n=1 Tax=Yoonia sediminilitoris TaxID=1286148 RepID=A0A2T6KC52_9RHOB|nr:ABC transporter permease [Yoonia sediminilitoris]PUB12438.1 putative ABC transport system permease protein [Yoonia sediminilitoris]RCW93132.1 putative ABC transport system permease protein [Yoonia sediminilitoris]
MGGSKATPRQQGWWLSVLWETIKLAVQAIFRNALRSFLTVLGIVIGVGAVIAMVTVGQGSTQQVTADVAKLGTNMLMVMPGQDAMQGGPPGTAVPMFTVRMNNLLEEQLSVVEVSAPLSASRARAVFGNENRRTDIIGTDNRYFTAARWEMARGRIFDASELQSGKPVCVIGETVRKSLFGNADPVGEVIRIQTLSCEVIGLTKSKGASTFGSDQDDFVIMPLKTFQRRIAGNTDVSMMIVAVREGVATERAQEQIELLMRDIRRIGRGEDDDFSVMDMKQLATMLSGITGVLTGLLSAVAAVSLLVGGIGIMNIMLVSVTERTREIGIRLAIGAQARQVLLQFLVEAIILSLFGGVIGIFVGLGLGLLGANMLSIPFQPDPVIVLLAFAFSAAVGVIFGYFPARRAARMNPIDALRRE